MANIENIPLNIKRSRWALKHFFVILATAISGMPMPEMFFLPGQSRWTHLPKHRYSDSIRSWIEHSTFQLRGGHSTTELSLHQSGFFNHGTFIALIRFD